MIEEISFLIDPSSDTPEKIRKLKSILKKINIDLEYDSSSNRLNFKYDIKEVDIRLTRRAGKKRKQPDGHYTLKEIKGMQKIMTATEIAEFLSLSRSTYFRRLAELKDSKDEAYFN